MLLLLVLRWPQNHGTNVHHNSRWSWSERRGWSQFMHGNTCLSLEQLGPSAKCLFKSDFYKLLKEWCVFCASEVLFLAFKSEEFLRKTSLRIKYQKNILKFILRKGCKPQSGIWGCNPQLYKKHKVTEFKGANFKSLRLQGCKFKSNFFMRVQTSIKWNLRVQYSIVQKRQGCKNNVKNFWVQRVQIKKFNILGRKPESFRFWNSKVPEYKGANFKVTFLRDVW